MGLRQKDRHATVQVSKPHARTEDLVIEELDDELLVYDRRNKRAHCLGATAAGVWRAFDGESSVADVAALLDLTTETVERAREELEVAELLDTPTLTLLNGNGNGNGITRRQLTKRGAQVGGAVVAAPLILSITAPTAAAAATPIPFQCEVYTVQSCGTSDACGHIFGCCCCCQGGGDCKTCGATNFCNAGTQPCSPVQGGGFGTHCSSVGSSPADARGCCGVSGAKQCGCGFGTYANCCNQNTGVTCSPSNTDTNCFPCCHGQVLTSAAALGCCTSQYTNCCSATPASCCAASTLKTDCCGPNPPSCCATKTCP